MSAYTCSECGETFEGFGAFGAHKQVHRRAARAAGSEPRPPRVYTKRRPRRIEDAPGADAGPSPDASTDPEPAQSRPARGRPSLAQPTIRISPEQRAESISDVVRDSLDEATLAGLVHGLSVALSEADGAGEAGHLSKIQCAQVAHLLYDPTIEFVVNRFGGDVNRFKAGMAVLLILIGKGAVHGRAIRDRVAERRARIAGPIVAAATIEATGEPTPQAGRRKGETAPQPAGLNDQLARQSQAFAGTPGNAE